MWRVSESVSWAVNQLNTKCDLCPFPVWSECRSMDSWCSAAASPKSTKTVDTWMDEAGKVWMIASLLTGDRATVVLCQDVEQQSKLAQLQWPPVSDPCLLELFPQHYPRPPTFSYLLSSTLFIQLYATDYFLLFWLLGCDIAVSVEGVFLVFSPVSVLLCAALCFSSHLPTLMDVTATWKES